jgi:hypothetical protein
MKKLLTLLAILLVSSLGHAQLRTPPMYQFEKVSWGQTLEQTREALGGIELKEAQHDLNGPFGGRGSKDKKFIYLDSIFQKRTPVSLVFSESTNRLSSVFVMFAWIGGDKSSTPEPKVWEDICRYYGKPVKEGVLPIGGSVSKWSFGKTELSAMRIKGTYSGIVLIYSPKE